MLYLKNQTRALSSLLQTTNHRLTIRSARAVSSMLLLTRAGYANRRDQKATLMQWNPRVAAYYMRQVSIRKAIAASCASTVPFSLPRYRCLTPTRSWSGRWTPMKSLLSSPRGPRLRTVSACVLNHRRATPKRHWGPSPKSGLMTCRHGTAGCNVTLDLKASCLRNVP